MITLSMFQEYLSSTAALPISSSRLVNGQERYLLKSLGTLTSQTEEQQAEYLETVLIALRDANIEESQRLKLSMTVIESSDRLIATLRQHYIYETGALSEEQLGYVAQIKSLNYLIIMLYDRVIRHESSLLDNKAEEPLIKRWQRYFGVDSQPSPTLAVAIFQSLLRYQKLLDEDALCYQKPSRYFWSQINQLYYLARQQGIAELDVSNHTAVPYASNLHQIYGQICLNHLLNVRAMRRPNILLVQRLLPEWANHIVATVEPTTETRVFVDLQSNNPPSYLTANSNINPYEEGRACLFIELTPLVQYFESRKQAFIVDGSIGMEYSLLSNIAMIIRYRYLQPPLAPLTQYSNRQKAVLMTSYNNIHYRVSHSQSFSSLIAIHNLPEDERPLYDTFRKEKSSHHELEIETFDNNDSFDSQGRASIFHTLRRPSQKNDSASTSTEQSHGQESRIGNTLINDKDSIQDKNPLKIKIIKQEGIDIETQDIDLSTTAPPRLHIMSLLLVCYPATDGQSDWAMGIARWRNFDTENPEVEWQLLGRRLVACGLRLEGDATRGRHFVPAFILGKDSQLQTTSTLIVPSSYFQTNDRVVMRINSKQTALRLGNRVLMTDELSQYEVIQL